ncbi:hypothetical protein EVAR_100227_1 [Eumeta japonica]|uniref:Uncharacterized protein n=1 Tax=Eumeta variegata TaxID=151549 RepID=A0A4C1ZW91_EUMVA|nr:hypothetical protein EVAR_100227_1 [Eumeta japonica]
MSDHRGFRCSLYDIYKILKRVGLRWGWRTQADRDVIRRRPDDRYHIGENLSSAAYAVKEFGDLQIKAPRD